MAPDADRGRHATATKAFWRKPARAHICPRDEFAWGNAGAGRAPENA